MSIDTSRLNPAMTPVEPSELGDNPGMRARSHAVTLEAMADAMSFDAADDAERRDWRMARIRAAATFLRNAAALLPKGS